MTSERSDKIDEVANDLDELKTTVEELKEDPPRGVKPKSVEKLTDAVERARDAADTLEEETDD